MGINTGEMRRRKPPPRHIQEERGTEERRDKRRQRGEKDEEHAEKEGLGDDEAGEDENYQISPSVIKALL